MNNEQQIKTRNNSSAGAGQVDLESPLLESSIHKQINIGITGAGAFADFAIKSFLTIEGVKLVAVMDTQMTSATKMATENNATAYNDLAIFLSDITIDLVYIATPPFLHYEQSRAALLAGKHVICEKPAALHSREAEELAALALSKNLLYVVNLMQRYNPLYEIVGTIIHKKLLGSFLHGYFENYASDENLSADHWFWDEAKSGGIFIEHGVHFFDTFAGWLGDGKVLSAYKLNRPSSEKKITDRVQATVLYEGGIVNFYHGFDQPKVLDRQEMRLLFELGEITLYEWIPVKMKLHGLLKDSQLKWLKEKLPGSDVVYNGVAQSKDIKAKGRFFEISYDTEITLEYGNAADKQNRYSLLLTNMLLDQWNWIKDPTHQRIIDGNNAIESVRIAEEANKMAQQINY